jgi:hypothetical protein
MLLLRHLMERDQRENRINRTGKRAQNTHATSLDTAPAHAQSAQHARPAQQGPSYQVVSSSWLPSTSPALPQLPSGEQYASEVLVNKVLVQGGTASGCTPYGSGLKVQAWTTNVNIPVNGGWIYPAAYYLANGAVRQEDDFEIEGSEGGVFTDPLGYDDIYSEYISGETSTTGMAPLLSRSPARR